MNTNLFLIIKWIYDKHVAILYSHSSYSHYNHIPAQYMVKTPIYYGTIPFFHRHYYINHLEIGCEFCIPMTDPYSI